MKIVILGAGTAGLIAALMLHEKYPLYEFTIVKSGDIGIVGVGEGSTEHWQRFTNFCGISVPELVAHTDCTYKIGILFKDWKKLDTVYAHSLDQTIPISSLDRLDVFGLAAAENADKLLPLSPVVENIFLKNNVPWSPLDAAYSAQFHFDTFKLNEFLLRKCRERHIQIVDMIVTDVTLNESDYITSIKNNELTIEGDFFIDCSGFNRVLGKKVGTEWIDYSKYLPMNHAIAFPLELKDAVIPPYTLSQALGFGWAWRIPTQNRFGNGYVFNDNYIDAENALHEFNSTFNTNVKEPARDIKFKAGRVNNFWHNNVLHIGLSSSFAEPLEAQSIGFTIIQMIEFLRIFDGINLKEPTNENSVNFLSKLYNKKMISCFDNIIDYLQIHYFSQRKDTDFWKNCDYQITDFNKDTFSFINKGCINSGWFEEHFMFREANWYQVCAGLGLIDEQVFLRSFLSNNRMIYIDNVKKQLANFWNFHNNMQAIDHRKMLNLIKENYFNNTPQKAVT